MIAVVQRVSSAQLVVEEGPGAPHDASIGRGLVALVGVERADAGAQADWIADKLASLRIFPDEAGRMNLSLAEAGGAILVVSQFTLAGDASKGARPSFIGAERPEAAAPLVERVAARLEARHGLRVARGVFGATMRISLVNEGPVTLILERRAAPAH